MKRSPNEDFADGFIQTYGYEAGVELCKKLHAANKWLKYKYGDLDDKVSATTRILQAFLTQLKDRDKEKPQDFSPGVCKLSKKKS